MDPAAVGDLVKMKRKEKGLTQEEVAGLSHLDTRTVQRVEKGEVKPFFSTLKALSQSLDFDFISAMNSRPWKFSSEEEKKYREIFKKRKFIRIVIMIAALAVLLAVATTFPDFRIFGLSKRTWAPFLYVFMFGLILAIAILWKCPACGASLGSPFNTRFCPRCGFQFYADEKENE
jgi:transcriptional regulator with XRE-family HTH domain